MAKKKTIKVKEPTTFKYSLVESGSKWAQQYSLKPAKPNGSYWDFISAKKLPIYYVVRVEYTTGDSFSTTPGNLTYPYLAETIEEGLAVASAIREHDKKVQDKFFKQDYSAMNSFELILSKKKVTISTSSWTGYFESLDGVDVVPVPVVE